MFDEVIENWNWRRQSTSILKEESLMMMNDELFLWYGWPTKGF